jgi:hypothetical protein
MSDDAPVEEIDEATLADADIRHAEVVWGADDKHAEVTFGGCSVYEALGLLVAGAVEVAFEAIGQKLDDLDDDDLI